MIKTLFYYYAGIYLILQPSCTSLALIKENTWYATNNSLTWINEQERIKVTFPNKSWHIYTKPTDVKWLHVESEYTVMHARIPELDIFLTINVLPNISNDVDYEEYYTFKERQYKTIIDNNQSGNILEYIPEMVQNGNKKTGSVTVTYKELINNIVFNYCEFSVLMKDQEKAVIFKFICRETLFKFKKQQFLDIANSYEYYDQQQSSIQPGYN